MGGSRCSKLRNYWNIFVTFLVSGIWHGANWTFIVWGCMHGISQIIEKILGQQKCNYGWFGKTIKIVITFIFVSFAWVFFRMPTLTDACGVMARIFDPSLPLSVFTDKMTFIYGSLPLLILIIKDVLDEFFPNDFSLLNNKKSWIRWSSYLILLIMVLSFGVFGADQFIYASF